MSSDPIEVLRDALARAMRAGYRSGHHDTVEGRYTDVMHGDHMDYFADEADELLADSDFAALAALSAPKPSSMNDNAVVVNESAPVNDKPKSAEAAAWAVTCPSGRTTAYMHPDPPKLTEPGWSARPLVYGDTAPPRPEASDEAWLLDPRTVEAKSQWDAVARALGADVDDPDAVLAAAKAKQASAPVGVEGVVKAMRMLAGVGIPVKPECVGRWADQLEALAQQPAAPRVRCGDERYELDAYLWRRESTQEWVLELSGAINDTSFTNRFPVPLSYAPEDAVSLPNYVEQPAACDMGELCIGCEPRNADGSCPAQQPAAVDGALERLRREGYPRLWNADLVGGQISVERMREILTAALAGQCLKNESDQEQQGGTPE